MITERRMHIVRKALRLGNLNYDLINTSDLETELDYRRAGQRYIIMDGNIYGFRDLVNGHEHYIVRNGFKELLIAAFWPQSEDWLNDY